MLPTESSAAALTVASRHHDRLSWQQSPLFSPTPLRVTCDEIPPLFVAMERAEIPLHDLIGSMPMSDAMYFASSPTTAAAAAEHSGTVSRSSNLSCSDSPTISSASGRSTVAADDVSDSVAWGGDSGNGSGHAKSPTQQREGGTGAVVGSSVFPLQNNMPPSSRANNSGSHNSATRLVVREMHSAVGLTPPMLPPLDRVVGVDLNTPPSTWLQSNMRSAAQTTTDPRLPFYNPWTPTPTGFSMVDMVASLLEEDGEPHQAWSGRNVPHQSFFHSSNNDEVPLSQVSVPDVVCPAEQLKRILLSNQNGNPLAFVAHRMGPSLIIEGAPHVTAKTVREARNRALQSKLLYFSVLAEEDSAASAAAVDTDGSSGTGGNDGTERSSADAAATVTAPATASSAVSSATSEDTASAVPSASSVFRKSLHWQFDNLSVLLGVNTPTITVAPQNKEVTLRLVDLEDPSSGSTTASSSSSSLPLLSREEAMDMWLDAIMAHVDGVALCYHTDGVVRGCQVVSTAQIPALSMQRFEPLAVQREARNVLGWLTQSCSKSGGSYVVIKDKNDCTLRLYDITAIGGEDASARTQHSPNRKGRSSSFGGSVTHDGVQSHHVTAVLTTEAVVATLPPPQNTSSCTTSSSVVNESLAAIDEDLAVVSRRGTTSTAVSSNSSSSSKTNADPAVFRVFTFPVAMMCLRMAQALPNSDAETLRLLQRTINLLETSLPHDSDLHNDMDADIHEEGSTDTGNTATHNNNAVVLFPLAKAHTLSMLHYHSSSPLSDAEKLCMRHAHRALWSCQRILIRTYKEIRKQSSSSSSRDVSMTAARAQDHMAMITAQENEVDSLIADVIRCTGALASQKVKHAKPVEAIECISVCQWALWLRRFYIPQSIASWKDDDVSFAPALHKFVGANAVERRQHDVLCAILHLETLVADITWHTASDVPDLSENGIHVAQLNRDVALSTARTPRGFEEKSALDFLARLAPLPSTCDALLDTATSSLMRAADVAHMLDTPAREIQRKCATIAARRAGRLADAATPQQQDTRAVVETLVNAGSRFHEACLLFIAASDTTNACMMAINASKMFIRAAKYVEQPSSTVEGGRPAEMDGEQTILELRYLTRAISVSESPIPAVAAVTASPMTSETHQATTSSVDTAAERALQMVHAHLANVFLIVAQKVLDERSTISKLLWQMSELPNATQSDGSPHSVIVARLVASLSVSMNENCHALTLNDSSIDKDASLQAQRVLLFAERCLLFPALWHAKRSHNVPLELHILATVYDTCMRAVGLEPVLKPQQTLPRLVLNLSPVDKVACVRRAVARARQCFSRMVSIAPSMVAADEIQHLVSVTAVTADLAVIYLYLIKHSELLVDSAKDDLGADGDKDSIGGSMVTQQDVCVDLVERTLTSLCFVVPHLTQLRQRIGHDSLTPERTTRLAAIIRCLCSSTSTAAMHLLRQMTAVAGESSSSSTDKTRKTTAATDTLRNAVRITATIASSTSTHGDVELDALASWVDSTIQVLNSIAALFEKRKRPSTRVV